VKVSLAFWVGVFVGVISGWVSGWQADRRTDAKMMSSWSFFIVVLY